MGANTLSSYSDCNALLKILTKAYKMELSKIHLHREMIGHVYFAESKQQRYVFKLYRPFHQQQALEAIGVIHYLMENSYPVAPIIPANRGADHIQVATPAGDCIGVLFAYIEGTEPKRELEIPVLGEQVGELHQLMQEYPGQLRKQGKPFYIDRFINLLRQLDYSVDAIIELEVYGQEIWQQMIHSTEGFCHGDLHTGNILKTKTSYMVFDFDTAAYAYPVVDIAVLSDATNFNALDEKAFDATRRMFDRFYTGYSKVLSISDRDIVNIFHFIAARHYELIATIAECEGAECLKRVFLDQQFGWLMKWRSLCNQVLRLS